HIFCFFFQAEDGIRDFHVTGVQTCALPIWRGFTCHVSPVFLNASPEQLLAHFKKTGDTWHVKPRLRRMISFAPMNLARSVYVGRMDCIFCMNVLMYFSEERRNELLQRFYDALEPGGLFFLGHSESMMSLSVRFQTAVYGDCK